jgi:hypothetical protein
MADEALTAWSQILDGTRYPWVLFSNGTCVVLTEPEPDPVAHAKRILVEWGPVEEGTSSTDFSVITLEEQPGWAVTSHHDDLLTFVGVSEFPDLPTDVAVGLQGRRKRVLDAASLQVIHVSDPR